MELMLKLRSVNGLLYLKADNEGKKLDHRARNITGEQSLRMYRVRDKI